MPLITPRKVKFSEPEMERYWTYIEKQLDMLIMQGQQFRTNDLPEWTRLLKGRPKDKERNFPFPGASNLVVQLIATRVEQMLSRIMAMYMVDPLWTVAALSDLPGQEADEMAKVLEQFLVDMAIDPAELALYRQEELFFHDAIAYGTSFMYLPYQYITEQQYVGIPGYIGANVRDEFKTLITKDGPVPENIPIQDIYISNKVTDIEKARFIGRKVKLTREAVEDRYSFGVWDKKTMEAILAHPDTPGTEYDIDAANDEKGIQTTGNEYEAIYNVFECFVKWVREGKMYATIAHYHYSSKTRASAVFNYFPKNGLPLEDCRFGYDSNQYLGYGFIEMLKSYQEEVSQLHNNRLDNEAIRNNVTFRADPDSELSSSLKFYPGVVVPARKDEVEVLETAAAGAMDNANSEGLSTSMANERSGIDPAIAGTGTGIVNPKRGIYSSQGTMAVLQQQNNRTGLRMMDARTAHVKIGRKLADMYAFIGAGSKIRRYGAQAETLRKALDSIKAGGLGLAIRASAGANNVESDKQNSVLLSQLQEKYIATMGQLMQALQNPQIQDAPDQVKWIQDTLFAENTLTRHIFRIFGYSDVDKLLPFPESVKNARSQQPQPNSSQLGQSVQSAGQNIIPIQSGAGANTVPIGPQSQQAS
jgi:hypothetical protein